VRLIRQLFKIVFVGAIALLSVFIILLAGILLIQYSSLKMSALNTVQAWQQENAWHSLNEYPLKLTDTILAVYDPKFKTRDECLSVWNQIQYKSPLFVTHGSQLSQIAAKMVQSGWAPVRSLQWHINGVLLTHFFACSYPKGDLLGIFLNRTYLGQSGEESIYGFHRGSQLYFSKDLNELSTSQMALLIAISHSPHFYDPRAKQAAALKHRSFVLSRMSESGMISAAEASLADKRILSE
jgi:membrane peptidoglycan carboxypeptidase